VGTAAQLADDLPRDIIRSFYSFLVAFGVNKGGINNPTPVKWSDATLLGQVPGTWDYTVATLGEQSHRRVSPLL
jgi:hypothetical protein